MCSHHLTSNECLVSELWIQSPLPGWVVQPIIVEKKLRIKIKRIKRTAPSGKQISDAWEPQHDKFMATYF